MDYKFKIKDQDNDPELDRLLNEMAKAYNNLMMYMIKKDLGVDVQIVDDEHICIDGEVMDAEQFQDWLDLNYPLEDEWEDDEDYMHHCDA